MTPAEGSAGVFFVFGTKKGGVTVGFRLLLVFVLFGPSGNSRSAGWEIVSLR